MPYIKQENRDRVVSGDTELESLSVGELNYVISSVMDHWLKENGVNYYNLNSVIGVLECAKQEFYRRVATEYENKKKEENGEVYESISAL